MVFFYSGSYPKSLACNSMVSQRDEANNLYLSIEIASYVERKLDLTLAYPRIYEVITTVHNAQYGIEINFEGNRNFISAWYYLAGGSLNNMVIDNNFVGNSFYDR